MNMEVNKRGPPKLKLEEKCGALALPLTQANR